MIKKIKKIIKLKLVAGKATTGYPIGPILGQCGINLGMFCKEYNEQTKELINLIIPVEITIYEDSSYSFILKSVPTAQLLLKYANIPKGSSNGKIIGTISLENLIEITKIKLNDLNTTNFDKALLIIKGTAKNMGININN